jgi:hypothetical protein
MGAKTKRAQKVRQASEFDAKRLSRALAVPKGTGISLTSWTLEQIFAARDAQLRGDFRQPARMAESMRTDDALAPALENRLAPQRCIPVEIVPAAGARGLPIAGEAAALFGPSGIAISPDTSASIHACLTNHDVAFAHCTPVPREDGTRIDYTASAWPIENVRWDPYDRCFKTRVDPSTDETAVGGEVPIVHGDGRWVIFQRFEIDPFKHATLLAAALIWARHAYGIRDWAKSSVAHGNVKMIGEMPAGVALQDADGDTADATALIELMRDMVSADSPVGIRPAGSKTEFVANGSPAWQVFNELVKNAESAAARLYLGTDAVMGSKGGAPGVDVQAMFGVAATKVQGDLACLSRGWQTGLIEPWCALNFGDSSLAPTRRYMLPDADADAEVASRGTRHTAFFEHIERARAGGFEITQAYVEKIAAQYDVEPPVLVLKPAAALRSVSQ